MTDYTKLTDFAAKDSLLSGNPAKVVRGSEIDTEFTNIAVAISTKTDDAAAAISGGTINNTPIGGSTPSTGAFTTLTSTGGAFNGTVGATTPSTGAFTTLSASGAIDQTTNNFGINFKDSFGSMRGGILWNASNELKLGAGTANAYYATISSTGLSVTGALSATGRLTTAGITEDSAGNLGLGVTPSAWSGYGPSLQGRGWALTSPGTDTAEYACNTYYNAGWKYTGSFGASYYQQQQGAHRWYTAPSGTAGNAITFTQAMDLDSTALTGGADNVRNLGSGAKRWATVYAGTGTINTSDAREKTEVVTLTAAEINAAKQLSKEVGTYKFLASIQAKGDAARTHIGMTVQRAIEIMEVNGLDPFGYGFICHDVWEDKFVEHPAVEAVEAKEAVLDDEGNVVTPAVNAVEGKAAWTEQTQVAGDRYAFRYDQLNLFIAAGIEARLSALEANV